jgi:hypothetical protein
MREVFELKPTSLLVDMIQLLKSSSLISSLKVLLKLFNGKRNLKPVKIFLLNFQLSQQKLNHIHQQACRLQFKNFPHGFKPVVVMMNIIAKKSAPPSLVARCQKLAQI